MVNPRDERYKHLIGQKLILPLVGRKIEIIGDEHVDMEFGTGVVNLSNIWLILVNFAFCWI